MRFARERRVPFFGICFGMQMAVIEAARNLADLPDACSTEFGPCDDPVVGLMTEWARGNEVERREASGDLGGTMRLGAYPAVLDAGQPGRARSTATRPDQRAPPPPLRGQHRITAISLERPGCASPACRPTACCPRSSSCPDHPWFVGVQFHPELKSKPFEPHPLFAGFIAAAVSSRGWCEVARGVDLR